MAIDVSTGLILGVFYITGNDFSLSKQTDDIVVKLQNKCLITIKSCPSHIELTEVEKVMW